MLVPILPAQVPAYAGSVPKPEPVFMIGLDGKLRLQRGELAPIFRPGTSAASTSGYTGFRFDGILSGIGLGDPPALRLTKSLSIAAMVRLESYPRESNLGAQIVFRGDERGGFDPYSLSVLPDGKVYFSVENARNVGDNVSAPIPLRHWTHVLGSLDDRTGTMTLWIDGAKATAHVTKVRPFGPLDPKAQPGVSIGNIQTQFGDYNQPLDGLIANLGIYDRAVTPTDLHLNLDGWDRPIF